MDNAVNLMTFSIAKFAKETDLSKRNVKIIQ